MSAAALPTPPIGAVVDPSTTTANPYVVPARMAYAAWRSLAVTLDDRAPRKAVIFDDYTGDVINAVAHGYVANQALQFVAGAGGALPTGITAGTVYYVMSGASLTADAFRVSDAPGNVNPTDWSTDGTEPINAFRTFAGLAANFAAVVSADEDVAQRWLREVEWVFANPGVTPKELYTAESENAVRLGWRYGALSKANKLSPYIDYSQFEGTTVATPNLRGYENLPEIEQARFEIIVAITNANRSRLNELTRRMGVSNGNAAPDPNYNALAVPARAFDLVSQVPII